MIRVVSCSLLSWLAACAAPATLVRLEQPIVPRSEILLAEYAMDLSGAPGGATQASADEQVALLTGALADTAGLTVVTPELAAESAAPAECAEPLVCPTGWGLRSAAGMNGSLLSTGRTTALLAPAAAESAWVVRVKCRQHDGRVAVTTRVRGFDANGQSVLNASSTGSVSATEAEACTAAARITFADIAGRLGRATEVNLDVEEAAAAGLFLPGVSSRARRKPWYFGATIGGTHLSPNGDSRFALSTSEFSSATGISVDLVTDLGEQFEVGGGFEYLGGGLDTDAYQAALGIGGLTSEVSRFRVLGRWWPFSFAGFKPFVGVEGGYQTMKTVLRVETGNVICDSTGCRTETEDLLSVGYEGWTVMPTAGVRYEYPLEALFDAYWVDLFVATVQAGYAFNGWLAFEGEAALDNPQLDTEKLRLNHLSVRITVGYLF